MAINTGTHPKLLWPGVREIWGQEHAQHPVEYTDLYNVQDSEQAYEQDVELTGFGLATVKGQGASVAYDTESQGWITTYTHIAYALGYIVTYEERKDNLYEEVSMRRAKGNAFSMAQTIENVAAFIYNNAFSTTYFTLPDAQALISTAHVNSSGGTYSNQLSSNADLSEAALEDMSIQIMLATNNRGLKIAVMPRSLHIAPSEWYNANRILKSVLQPGTTSNNINVLKATNAYPDGIKMNHYFTSPHAWFVRTNIPNGMNMFWRERPGLEQDNDFDTKNAKAASYMRFSVGCTDGRGIFGSNGP